MLSWCTLNVRPYVKVFTYTKPFDVFQKVVWWQEALSISYYDCVQYFFDRLLWFGIATHISFVCYYEIQFITYNLWVYTHTAVPFHTPAQVLLRRYIFIIGNLICLKKFQYPHQILMKYFTHKIMTYLELCHSESVVSPYYRLDRLITSCV